MAHRRPSPVAAAPPPSVVSPVAEVSRQALCARLAAVAHEHPHRIAFIDPAGKAAWTGRRPIVWSYGAAAEIVARLANGLKNWRLPPASRIGLLATGGSETLLSYLAVEAAGHVPCLLPGTWDEDGLVAAVQAAGIAAVLTQSRFGAAMPADRMCRVAVRYFGLRYLAAFGPDVPDGVISLDGMVLDERGGPFAPEVGGLVSFAGGDPTRPVHRPGDALLAAIAVHLAAARVAPGERILSLLAPGDLRGLVTGLGAAIVAGAALETLPVFDAAAFATALDSTVATHLVVPAALERNLAASRVPETLRSITLAHRVPGLLPARSLPAAVPSRVIDTVVFDETALLAVPRSERDIARLLAAPAPAEPDAAGAGSALLAVRQGADGHLAFRGPACRAAPVQRGNNPAYPADAWSPSPFRVTVLDGRATGIVRA